MSNTVPRLFSQAGTGSAMPLEAQSTPGTSQGAVLPWRAPGKSLSDLHFLRSWIESKAEKTTGSRRAIKWNKVLGLLLVLGVSGGFWVGVGLLLMRLWK
jgi:hypothetical protein